MTSPAKCFTSLPPLLSMSLPVQGGRVCRTREKVQKAQKAGKGRQDQPQDRHLERLNARLSGTHFSWACEDSPRGSELRSGLHADARLYGRAALTSMSSLEASSLKATIMAVVRQVGTGRGGGPSRTRKYQDCELSSHWHAHERHSERSLRLFDMIANGLGSRRDSLSSFRWCKASGEPRGPPTTHDAVANDDMQIGRQVGPALKGPQTGRTRLAKCQTSVTLHLPLISIYRYR